MAQRQQRSARKPATKYAHLRKKMQQAKTLPKQPLPPQPPKARKPPKK
jgi:hypothetical protein